MSSLTDTHLVYKITLCLRRQLSAGQTCRCLCLAIASRKQDLGGCFCGCPAVLVSSEELHSRSRVNVPVAACFCRACPGRGGTGLFQPPRCSHLCRGSEAHRALCRGASCRLRHALLQARMGLVPATCLSFSICFSINSPDI